MAERAAYPGPKARAVIERMRRVEGAGPRTGAGEPLVIDHAMGATLVDPDGNRFTDLAGSFAAATIGHSHPDVVAAVATQIGAVSHVSSAALSEQRVGFEEDLLAIAPSGLDRVLLGISGADANDLAVRLARSLTGRREVLAFSGGYFGRAAGVVGLNGKSAFRTAAGVDVDAHFLPYPDPYRWPESLGGAERAGDAALELVRQVLEDPASGVGRLAAIIVEPIQGNGGVVVPPDGFLAGLRALCDTHGVPLIFDEIQSGFGRSGRMWAAEHWGVVPDLMTVGKGIGGGLALSAVVGRESHMSHWSPGTHTSTFIGNAVNLAAGRAAIGVMCRNRLWERSARLGASVLERLQTALVDEPSVGDVRGKWLFIGIELVRDRATREPDRDAAAGVRARAFADGVVLATAGRYEQVVKISPPLTIDEGQANEAVDIVVDAIRRGR
ncbi:MAG TPA: aspartate aminotransferase family protein [Candidatus Limnocylindrales bacterium]|nr:aspartate aminotransferase family protein [Candidatus Limnocylindrales bacterium]